jgi:hypothetical protein
MSVIWPLPMIKKEVAADLWPLSVGLATEKLWYLIAPGHVVSTLATMQLTVRNGNVFFMKVWGAATLVGVWLGVGFVG